MTSERRPPKAVGSRFHEPTEGVRTSITAQECGMCGLPLPTYALGCSRAGPHLGKGREGEMPNEGFGSSLWRNVQAVKLGKDGSIEAPVRANSRQGIVVGVDVVRASDAAQAVGIAATPAKSPGGWRRFFRR